MSIPLPTKSITLNSKSSTEILRNQPLPWMLTSCNCTDSCFLVFLIQWNNAEPAIVKLLPRTLQPIIRGSFTELHAQHFPWCVTHLNFRWSSRSQQLPPSASSVSALCACLTEWCQQLIWFPVLHGGTDYTKRVIWWANKVSLPFSTTLSASCQLNHGCRLRANKASVSLSFGKWS